MPNHQLRLEIEVAIMLLGNIDQHAGMCNVAHLIITRTKPYLLEAKVICGSYVGQKVIIYSQIIINFNR